MKLTQCEGCAYPLMAHLADYEAGKIDVTWILCPHHEREVELMEQGSESA